MVKSFDFERDVTIDEAIDYVASEYQIQKLRTLSALSGGLAHNINNALTAIGWNADLLALDHSNNEKTLKHILTIKKNANHIADIVKQLMAYSRIGKYREEEICLSHYLSQMLPSLISGINPDIKIKTILHRVPLTKVEPKQLEMALSAILKNASEATGQEKQIDISLDQTTIDELSPHDRPGLLPGPYVCLKIADNGVGMDDATKAKIFDPFFTTKRFGRGLSMAAVYGIIKSINGWIYVDSELGSGTKVSIFFQYI